MDAPLTLFRNHFTPCIETNILLSSFSHVECFNFLHDRDRVWRICEAAPSETMCKCDKLDTRLAVSRLSRKGSLAYLQGVVILSCDWHGTLSGIHSRRHEFGSLIYLWNKFTGHYSRRDLRCYRTEAKEGNGSRTIHSRGCHDELHSRSVSWNTSHCV